MTFPRGKEFSTRNLPRIAREYAKWKEARFLQWVDADRELARSKCAHWSPGTLAGYDKEKKLVEEELEYALRISYEAGFPFKDRHGQWRDWGEKPGVVEEVIDLFFSRMPLRVQDPEALTGDFADDFASLASSQGRATAVSCALWLAGDFASLVSSQGSATAVSLGFS
jgi:hypothetical protein